MRALVVYESMFGNTREVAEAVADGLARHGQVDLVEVGQAMLPIPDDLELLVIGGPTHAFSMSRPNSRQSATQQASTPVISAATGIREWIARLARTGRKVDTAVFDTRFAKPLWMTGSAARGAAKRIRRMGIPLAAAPQSFFVTGMSGPLAQGEPARAREWGESLARVASRHHLTGRSREFGPM
jgi:flavorubredoxin